MTYKHLGSTRAIFLISILGLYLELMLIRWISTEIRIFAYLQNTVLIVCFLGLGFGLFTSRQTIVLKHLLVPLFTLVLSLAVAPVRNFLATTITTRLSVFEDLLIWFKGTGGSTLNVIRDVVIGSVLTLVLMVIVMIMFIPIGRILGRLMNEHPRIIYAYSVNILGSLVGIWLFVLTGVLYLPPVVWLALLAVLVLPFLDWARKAWVLDAALLAGTVALAWLAGYQPGAVEAVWSPYQKLVLHDSRGGQFPNWHYTLLVNNTGYQALIDLGPDDASPSQETTPSGRMELSQYDLPPLFHQKPRRMLIVGAGTGNDVAGALRQDVPAITAVEIDPAILSFGRAYHPEQPYRSSRVRQVIDDARSFFASCRERFDVISFGLLDSHTTTSMTNARLDHFVYTKESIQKARSLLADGGVLVMSFAAQRSFIVNRFARTLREVFGADPLCFWIPVSRSGWGGHMFVAGDMERIRQQVASNPRLSKRLIDLHMSHPVQPSYDTEVATDDWPYIYLERRHIPLLYYLLAGLMVILFLVCRKFFGPPRGSLHWRSSHWHFFFLGAAFLLLEVQNVSKSALVLGNTWLTNAVIISGVLVMVLAANALAARFPGLKMGRVYVLLFASCAALYFVDIAGLASAPFLVKSCVVGAMTTLPMLFSGIVFIRSFSVVREKDTALGANLTGALAGAMLQSITFLVGFQALLLVIAGLYLLSLLTLPRGANRERARA